MTNESNTDCRSEVGITVGLVDALISILRVLSKRDLTPREVEEALKDLYADSDLHDVLHIASEL